jgi:hypothetical protein
MSLFVQYLNLGDSPQRVYNGFLDPGSSFFSTTSRPSFSCKPQYNFGFLYIDYIQPSSLFKVYFDANQIYDFDRFLLKFDGPGL